MKPVANLTDKLCFFLGTSPIELMQLVQTKHKFYKKYEIPKASGGSRTIYHPCKHLKAVQRAINEVFFKRMPTHNISYAYIPEKKSPLRASALQHKNYAYTVRIDFEDFFYSITAPCFFHTTSDQLCYSEAEYDLFKKALFIQKKFGEYTLPIGAPSSPYVSNIVMYDVDDMFFQSAKQIDKNSAISRYADDLYFSSNKKGTCADFEKAVRNIILKSDHPSLSINENKTLYLSKGTKRVVNGLYITSQGGISIGRKRKIEIKKLLYRHYKNELNNDEIQKAKGTLAFIKDVEPNYYDKLALKYGNAFMSIITHQ